MQPGRPHAQEHDPYYAGYIDQVEGDDILSLLRGQIDETEDSLGDADDSIGPTRYEEGKWSVNELVGHLIDSERVFVYRAVCIARGERASLPGMDQDDYVRGGNFDARSLADLVGEFRDLRRSTVSFFSGLDAESWRRVGTANDAGISVRALAFIVGGHQAHHMKVLRERYLNG